MPLSKARRIDTAFTKTSRRRRTDDRRKSLRSGRARELRLRPANAAPHGAHVEGGGDRGERNREMGEEASPGPRRSRQPSHRPKPMGERPAMGWEAASNGVREGGDGLGGHGPALARLRSEARTRTPRAVHVSGARAIVRARMPQDANTTRPDSRHPASHVPRRARKHRQAEPSREAAQAQRSSHRVLSPSCREAGCWVRASFQRRRRR